MTRIAKAALALVCTGLVTGLVVATAAYAAPGVAMSVDVTTSQIDMVGGPGGTCEWTVVSTVTLVNLTNSPITVTTVDASADYNGPSGLIGRTAATILDDGGLQTGVTLAANGVQSFSDVKTSAFIPCAATYAQVEFRVTSPTGVNAGDAPFLDNGTPVPVRTIAGAAALTALVASAFALRQWRRPRGEDPAMPKPGAREGL